MAERQKIESMLASTPATPTRASRLTPVLIPGRPLPATPSRHTGRKAPDHRAQPSIYSPSVSSPSQPLKGILKTETRDGEGYSEYSDGKGTSPGAPGRSSKKKKKNKKSQGQRISFHEGTKHTPGRY
jgi:hypothetical protein